MTSYIQYKITNPPSQALDILSKLGKIYSFVSEFDSLYRILIITTKDTNLITFIDSKTIPNLTKTTITISEYDDTKTITDVETLILTNADVSSIRPEMINSYKSTLTSLQSQTQNLKILNWQTMKIADLQSAINTAQLKQL